MARIATPLKARQVETNGPGTYADGNGLYLIIVGRSRAWEFRYKPPGNGPRRQMGLGNTSKMSLAQAREAVRKLQDKLAAGIDPIEERNAQRRGETPVSELPTFRQCAEAYIAKESKIWRSPKHIKQWEQSLAKYVYKHIGDKPVRDIVVKDVLAVLEPIWLVVPTTADRVRNRIEMIIDFAVGKDYRSEDSVNPAQRRGKLKSLLVAPTKAVARKREKLGVGEHFKSLPYEQVPQFMSWLNTRGSLLSIPVLEFAILTANRIGATRQAEWKEINFDTQVWTIPGPKMKNGKPHRVALSDRAVELLKQQEAKNLFNSNYVFPGEDGPHAPVSEEAVRGILNRSVYKGTLTAHGFRSTFRVWAAKQRTRFSWNAAEAALAHTLGKVAGAYQGDDLLEERQDMMQAWADYISSTGDVVPFKQQPAALAG